MPITMSIVAQTPAMVAPPLSYAMPQLRDRLPVIWVWRATVAWTGLMLLYCAPRLGYLIQLSRTAASWGDWTFLWYYVLTPLLPTLLLGTLTLRRHDVSGLSIVSTVLAGLFAVIELGVGTYFTAEFSRAVAAGERMSWLDSLYNIADSTFDRLMLVAWPGTLVVIAIVGMPRRRTTAGLLLSWSALGFACASTASLALGPHRIPRMLHLPWGPYSTMPLLSLALLVMIAVGCACSLRPRWSMHKVTFIAAAGALWVFASAINIHQYAKLACLGYGIALSDLALPANWSRAASLLATSLLGQIVPLTLLAYLVLPEVPRSPAIAPGAPANDRIM